MEVNNFTWLTTNLIMPGFNFYSATFTRFRKQKHSFLANVKCRFYCSTSTQSQWHTVPCYERNAILTQSENKLTFAGWNSKWNKLDISIMRYLISRCSWKMKSWWKLTYQRLSKWLHAACSLMRITTDFRQVSPRCTKHIMLLYKCTIHKRTNLKTVTIHLACLYYVILLV